MTDPVKEAFLKLTPEQRQEFINTERMQHFKDLLKMMSPPIDGIKNLHFHDLVIEELQKIHIEACAEEAFTGESR